MLVQSCQECVFAKYEAQTQKGCSSGYLDKFLNKGCVKEGYNETGEFFLIEGFRCPAYRDIKKWKTPDLDRLKRELVLNIDVLLTCHSFNKEEQIVAAVRNFEKQIVKPRKVIIILWENIVKDEQGKGSRKIIPSSLARKFEHFDIDIDISESVNNDKSSLDAIDRILVNNDSNYYVHAYPSVLATRMDFISRVNSLIFDDFRNFIYITQLNDTFPVVNTKLHNMMGGNRDGKTIEQKMIVLANQNPETMNTVLKGEEVWTTQE